MSGTVSLVSPDCMLHLHVAPQFPTDDTVVKFTVGYKYYFLLLLYLNFEYFMTEEDFVLALFDSVTTSCRQWSSAVSYWHRVDQSINQSSTGTD